MTITVCNMKIKFCKELFYSYIVLYTSVSITNYNTCTNTFSRTPFYYLSPNVN